MKKIVIVVVVLVLALVIALVTHTLARIDPRVAWPWRCLVVAVVGLVGGWL